MGPLRRWRSQRPDRQVNGRTASDHSRHAAFVLRRRDRDAYHATPTQRGCPGPHRQNRMAGGEGPRWRTRPNAVGPFKKRWVHHGRSQLVAGATQFRSKISQCSPSGFILGPCTDARRVLGPKTQIEEAESNRWCGRRWILKHAKFRLLSVQPKTELELYRLARVTRSRPLAFD